MLLNGVLNTGEKVDLTRMAKYQLDGGVATVSPQGRIRTVADGNGTLNIEVAGHKVQVPWL